ncbi:MAG: DUF4369 domain-containing protein, partial [Bacteroidia bacterium]|nr:DUF4369 domain-containing protein [Bacteroidia bacterium]
MKHFWIVLVGLLLFSCSKDESKQMLVKGQVAGLKKGVLYLQHVPDSTLVTMDSLEIRGDGSFQFEVALEHPELFYLYLEKDDQNEVNDRIPFFGESGQITINTQWDAFDTKAKIEGSESHAIYTEYKKVMTRFNTEYLSLAQEKLASPAEPERIDSLNKRMDQTTLRSYLYTVNFALNNRNSHVAPFLAVIEIPDVQNKYLDTIYNALPDSI